MTIPDLNIEKISEKNLLIHWHDSLLRHADVLLNERRQILSEAGEVAKALAKLGVELEAPSEKTQTGI